MLNSNPNNNQGLRTPHILFVSSHLRRFRAETAASITSVIAMAAALDSAKICLPKQFGIDHRTARYSTYDLIYTVLSMGDSSCPLSMLTSWITMNFCCSCRFWMCIHLITCVAINCCRKIWRLSWNYYSFDFWCNLSPLSWNDTSKFV